MLLSFPRSSCFVLLTITSVSLVIITNKLYNILLLTITSVYLVNITNTIQSSMFLMSIILKPPLSKVSKSFCAVLIKFLAYFMAVYKIFAVTCFSSLVLYFSRSIDACY